MADERPINLEEFNGIVLNLVNRLCGRSTCFAQGAPFIHQSALPEGPPGAAIRIMIGFSEDVVEE